MLTSGSRLTLKHAFLPVPEHHLFTVNLIKGIVLKLYRTALVD